MKYCFSLLMITLLLSCNTKESSTHYDSKNYNVYMRGNEAGTQTSSFENGIYNYTFTYNDRGRGPEIKQTITLNEQGSISSMEISGVNYLKDTISEVFKIENEKAYWESTSEKGNDNYDENTFYVSINGTLGDSELLVQKLLSTPNQTVNLYPNGTVKISNIDEITIENNPLRLLEITGFGFTPNYIWVDADNRIFCFSVFLVNYY